MLRKALLVGCALVAGVLCVPAAAIAAAAPTLTSPKASADNVTTGTSLVFEWNGNLGGDADTLDRSFFRVELISASKMPAGAQAEWPMTDVENFAQTEPGQDVTTATLGVPLAGEYRWRVCAWGVSNMAVNNSIQQLPGGCSSSRAFTVIAATKQVATIGELPIKTRKQVDGGVRKVYVERPDEPAPVTPEPAAPNPVIEQQQAAPAPVPVTRVQDVVRRDVGEEGTAVELGSETLLADTAANRKGLGGALMTGLSMNLPFLPIPFWTLALLIVCVPIARAWRRNVLAMFDWPDGSHNGRGVQFDALEDLQMSARDTGVQIRSTTADGDATVEPIKDRSAA